ncbi:MAG: HEAT repeat domain-containing protein, partial [Planctomycetota bacterium]
MDKDTAGGCVLRGRLSRPLVTVLFFGLLSAAVVLAVLYARLVAVETARHRQLESRASWLASEYEQAAIRDDTSRKIGISLGIEAMGECAFPVLEAMYGNANPDLRIRTFMRVRATQLLHKIPSGRATKILLERLKDEDEQVRYAALTTLGYRADAVALDAVLAAYK